MSTLLNEEQLAELTGYEEMPLERLSKLSAYYAEYYQNDDKILTPVLEEWEEVECKKRGETLFEAFKPYVQLLFKSDTVPKAIKLTYRDKEQKIVFSPLITPKGETKKVERHHVRWIHEFYKRTGVFDDKEFFEREKKLVADFIGDGRPFTLARWHYFQIAEEEMKRMQKLGKVT